MGHSAVVLLVTIFSLCTCDADNLQTTYQESLSSAVAHFTQSIYIHLAKTTNQENFVFSPLSLHSALSLLPGYQGQLHHQGAAGGRHGHHQQQIHHYRTQNSFIYGNHIWIGQELEVDEEYANDDSFSADTQMFLANALYFKEGWKVPFEEEDYNGNMIEKDFITDSGKVKVPMIWQESELFGFVEIRTRDGLMEVVTIPYNNENFEMQLIIPESNKHFSIIENKMDLEKERDKNGESFNLFHVLKNESKYQYDEVQLVFPKFNVRSKFNAANALKTLGAKEVFTTGAEFNKITAGGPTGVGNILHEAVVEVTKDGTEGSAATGLELTLFSGGFQKQILVDRPFIFIIQDKVNNIPVLVGRIKNPTLKNP